MKVLPVNPGPSFGSVKTTCPYCGVGCGVIVNRDDEGKITVKGDREHPSSQGYLCSKGTALAETLDLDDRLLFPEVNGKRVRWEQAIDTVAGKLKSIISEHGPEAVAFYVSGQLMTEDYYVANKLMKGYIGSGNIDTNSRLCMSSAVAAYKRAFGEDCVPCSYNDIDSCDLIVLTGSNAAWCHPVLYQRIVRAKKNNPDLFVVNIDPRVTQTSSIADIQLSLAPGSDAILFNGLLTYIIEQGKSNSAYINAHTSGSDEAIETARSTAPNIGFVADACNLKVEDVELFYQKFADTERTITAFSQGINQSSSGTDKGNAIINCHLATGRIGRQGMGPFSLTGQPNAMGGREVGGLANQLAAHLEIDNPTHQKLVQDFWSSPKIAKKAGYKAVDLFDAVYSGKIKAVWIMATNPVVSMPDADTVKKALADCDCVIVSECVNSTDTTEWADIKLPAATWGERNGTVTNSERRITRQLPFLPLPGEAKPDWQIISEVARKMGFTDAFSYHSSADIFVEHAKLSGYQNSYSEETFRKFNIELLASMDQAQYDTMQAVQWPVSNADPFGTERLYEDGKFSTASGRANFISVTPCLPAARTSREFPFILNTGRVRDQWHTMTRTGKSPRLSSHCEEAYVEIHPDSALEHALEDKKLATVSTPSGEITVRVKVSDKQRRDSIFVPIHWSEQNSSNARVGKLIAASVDPVSGQPESKHHCASIKPCPTRWHSFLITRKPVSLEYSDYWSLATGEQLIRYELAGNESPDSWKPHVRKLLKQTEDSDWVEMYDTAADHYRAANFINQCLESFLIVCNDSKLPDKDWVLSLFNKDSLDKHERLALLSGIPPKQAVDAGRTICACFGVGKKTIEKAIREQNLGTAEDIGQALSAGTNCGSCIPELNEILLKGS